MADEAKKPGICIHLDVKATDSGVQVGVKGAHFANGPRECAPEAPHASSSRSSSGAVSDDYRTGWDRIFGEQRPAAANN